MMGSLLTLLTTTPKLLLLLLLLLALSDLTVLLLLLLLHQSWGCNAYTEYYANDYMEPCKAWVTCVKAEAATSYTTYVAHIDIIHITM
jgi:hypothetical protein